MTTRTRTPRLMLLLLMPLLGAAPTLAQEPPTPAEDPEPTLWQRVRGDGEKLLDNEYYKIGINVRLRTEIADFDGFSQSEAYTMRTLAGIRTKPLWGFSALAQLENSFSFAPSQYFDGVGAPTGQTLIADPPETDLNQGYLQYQNAEWWDLNLIGGRQMIVLDDQRFVGNVGWRQNMQTFDAGWASTSFGIDDLELAYSYLWSVERIFGNDGPSAQRDYHSKSHIVHLSFDRLAEAKLAAFAYLFDFENSSPASKGNSANSFGFRVTGDHTFGDGPWSAGYAASYAYQTQAGGNPVHYNADYVAAETNAGYAGIGRVGIGYELLGSDHGTARFVTPLATGHKFNGWADVFLNNGGNNGLQDLYVSVAPALPWKFTGQVIYHRFWSNWNDTHLGDEVDAVLSRPILAPWLTGLVKGAYFDGTPQGPASGWRFWVELTFNY